MKKILVTGGAGFIGFNLVLRLLDEGYSVISIDNINSYYDKELKIARLGLIEEIKNVNYKFHQIDLNDRDSLGKLFLNQDIDCVVNLAAQAGVRHAKKNPDVYIESNIIGFYNLLEECKRYRVKKIIYASSSSVYGSTTKLPFTEDDPANTPMSIYAATKKSNEDLASSFFYSYGIRTIGLRFFNIYGPFGRPDMAYYTWAERMSRGDSIELRDNGEMWRDMTYIDDCIECVWRLIEDEKNEGSPEIYNIGNRSPVKIKDVLGYISQELNITPNIEFRPRGIEEPIKTWADTSMIKNKINFEPNTNYKSGLDRFLSWYKEYHNLS